VLYRTFPFDPKAAPNEDGGPLFVARALQGTSRHDNPDRYGALYLTRRAESAVAERIQVYRGRTLTEAHLRRGDGRAYALVAIDDSALDPMPDLDDPAELVARGLRPSGVATRDRAVTQAIALSLFEDGAEGFGWWSTLEASWPNVTLFSERSAPKLSLAAEPEVLSLHHPVVQAAADRLGMALAR
jgi:RES domain